MQLNATETDRRPLQNAISPPSSCWRPKFQAVSNKDKLSTSLSLPPPPKQRSLTAQHSLLRLKTDTSAVSGVTCHNSYSKCSLAASHLSMDFTWYSLVSETRQNGSTQLVVAEVTGLNRIAFPCQTSEESLLSLLITCGCLPEEYGY